MNRHFERSEAIQQRNCIAALHCGAALAMTNTLLNAP
jgi:hypothetical protein